MGPAAYLVDLLRIIDKAVTQPNSTRYNQADNIPAGLKFFERRPDIAELPLTCSNTNSLVPYLKIVNEVLERTVHTELQTDKQLVDGDVWLTLAHRFFPANLPYHRPLALIRSILGNAKTGAAGALPGLAEIFEALQSGSRPSLPACREFLGLTIEQAANLYPVNGEKANRVAANYGVPVAQTGLAGLDQLDTFMKQTGLARADVSQLFGRGLSAREIFDVSGAYHLDSRGATLVLTQNGDSVTGTFDYPSDLKNGQISAILSGRVLKGYWKCGTNQAPAGAGSIEFEFAADGATFTGRWSRGYAGAWESSAWNGTRTDASRFSGGIIPHSLFINASLPPRASLGITVNDDNPQKTFEQITHLSIDALDDINRFTRLAAVLGWSYMDLEWVLISLSAPALDGNGNLTSTAKIDEGMLIEIAKIKKLKDAHQIPLSLLTALWFDLRTIGEGDGPVSQTPFDRVFNSLPAFDKASGGQPYHPAIAPGASSYANPLYRDEVLS